MIQALRKLLISSREDGIAATMRLIQKNVVHEFRWYLDRKFDRTHGTDTSERIELKALDIVGNNKNSGTYYEPTSTALFKHIAKEICPALSFQDFIFIDYGSGKGRTLLLASDYNFKLIIGVEFSRDLHLIAEKNISIYRHSRQCCREFILINSDASEFVPPAGNLFVYLYNPFLKDVMSRVLKNLADAISASSSKMVLVYLNPLSSDVVEGSGIFKRCLEINLPHDYTREVQRKCNVYFSWLSAPGTMLTQHYQSNLLSGSSLPKI